MYNLDLEKKIIFILAVPLMLLSIFLLSLGSGIFASQAKEYGDYSSETIYARRECADGVCHDVGKKLISFKGIDAECEDYKSEDERMKCYFNNSQASFSCPNLEDKGEVEDCYEKYRGPVFNYYQGGAGTLVATQSFVTGGSRMYLNGFDSEGRHVFKTGTDEPSNNAITFREASRDVQYGGNLDVRGDITIRSVEGGVYFGSDIEYGETNISGSYQAVDGEDFHSAIMFRGREQGDSLKGQGIVKYDNFNGLNLNRCMDMKVLANHNHLMTIPGNEREHFGSVEMEKGLEVDGSLKSNFMFFQGRFLAWSEPIRGHWILYYNTPPEAPSSCELPGYPRDIPPITYPSIDGEEEGEGATAENS